MTETTSAPHTGSSHASPKPGVTMNLKNIDWHILGAKTIINAFGGYALYLSYGHITDLFETWGAESDQAHAAPAFIDGFMILGRIMQSKRFCDRICSKSFC